MPVSVFPKNRIALLTDSLVEKPLKRFCGNVQLLFPTVKTVG